VNNKMSELYRSPQFAIFVELYEIYKRHPKKVFAFLLLEFLIHANALHHISELRDMWQALLFWQ